MSINFEVCVAGYESVGDYIKAARAFNNSPLRAGYIEYPIKQVVQVNANTKSNPILCIDDDFFERAANSTGKMIKEAPRLGIISGYMMDYEPPESFPTYAHEANWPDYMAEQTNAETRAALAARALRELASGMCGEIAAREVYGDRGVFLTYPNGQPPHPRLIRQVNIEAEEGVYDAYDTLYVQLYAVNDNDFSQELARLHAWWSVITQAHPHVDVVPVLQPCQRRKGIKSWPDHQQKAMANFLVQAGIERAVFWCQPETAWHFGNLKALKEELDRLTNA